VEAGEDPGVGLPAAVVAEEDGAAAASDVREEA